MASHDYMLSSLSPTAKVVYQIIQNHRYMDAINKENISIRKLMKWVYQGQISIENALEELQQNLMIHVVNPGERQGSEFHLIANNTMPKPERRIDFSTVKLKPSVLKSVQPVLKSVQPVLKSVQACIEISTDADADADKHRASQGLRLKDIRKKTKEKNPKASILDSSRLLAIEVCQLWNNECAPAINQAPLQDPRHVSDARFKKMKPALKLFPRIENWKLIFDEIAMTDWLNGDNQIKGKKHYTVNFDYFFKGNTYEQFYDEAVKRKNDQIELDKISAKFGGHCG